jgi:hypothetical protein
MILVKKIYDPFTFFDEEEDPQTPEEKEKKNNQLTKSVPKKKFDRSKRRNHRSKFENMPDFDSIRR